MRLGRRGKLAARMKVTRSIDASRWMRRRRQALIRERIGTFECVIKAKSQKIVNLSYARVSQPPYPIATHLDYDAMVIVHSDRPAERVHPHCQCQ